jgi:hypothetical protein
MAFCLIIFLSYMVAKKFIITIFLPLLLTSLLLSQSLAELSKKEKERRESLKGKKVVVITNADLTKGARKPALNTPPLKSLPETAPEETIYTPPPGPEKGLPPSPSPEELNPPPQDEFKTELESRWAKAKEYADLLETKMAALWQEFYSMDDMTSRDSIQREISETFTKLEKAREEEAKAKDELDQYLASIRKEKAPPIWFR